MPFKNRLEPAARLAEKLGGGGGLCGGLVLGLPRGGVPLAAELARLLNLPLDVFVSRRLFAENDPGVSLGAVTEAGNLRVNAEVPAALRCSCDLPVEVRRQKKEADWRRRLYRGGRPLPVLAGRPVIAVDDGAATGMTMAAALEALRFMGPSRLTAALPVAPPEALPVLKDLADDLIVLETPRDFLGIAGCYEDYPPVTDAEILELLTRRGAAAGGARRGLGAV